MQFVHHRHVQLLLRDQERDVPAPEGCGYARVKKRLQKRAVSEGERLSRGLRPAAALHARDAADQSLGQGG